MNNKTNIFGTEVFRTPNTPLLVVMVGPSCSGKSTLIRNQLVFSKTKTETVVSRDTVREYLFGEYKMGEEGLVSKICNVQIESYLKFGDVYVDNTHLQWRYIKGYLEQYNDVADVYYHLMPLTSLDKLQERATTREVVTGKHIPKDVIEKMYHDYDKLREEWEEAEYPTFFPRHDELNTKTT